MRSLAPLAAATLITITALAANAGVVEDRKANFKANNASMRVIGAAIGAGDFETVSSEAEKIAAWAMVMPDYFPEGSGAGTSAKPAIWSDFVGFKDAAEANYYAAQDSDRRRRQTGCQGGGRGIAGGWRHLQGMPPEIQELVSLNTRRDAAAAVHVCRSATRRSAPAQATSLTG